MKEALVVGGANGIGLAVAMELAGRPGMRCVHIVDKAPLAEQYRKDNVRSYEFDLTDLGSWLFLRILMKPSFLPTFR